MGLASPRKAADVASGEWSGSALCLPVDSPLRFGRSAAGVREGAALRSAPTILEVALPDSPGNPGLPRGATS
jgi:hypothetical protein